MTVITALDGTQLTIDDNSVTLITGPNPDDPAERSYIAGPEPGTIVSAEDAAALVARLHPKHAFVVLTRPDGTPVWINGSAVSVISPPSPFDIPDGETVGAVLQIGGRHQAVKEDLTIVKAKINAGGGHF